MIAVHGTKQKKETLGMIAKAWNDADVGDVIEVIQPNELGGKSIEKLLKNHFTDIECESKNKTRYIALTKTAGDIAVIAQWLDYQKMRFEESIGFYTVPGIYGWDKIDAGSAMLLASIDQLKGVGSDFGCGYGYLSRNILEKYEGISALHCYDIDTRAVDACRMNVIDERASFDCVDCTAKINGCPPLDFIVMNPPFHDGKSVNIELGGAMIVSAYMHLKKRGVLWMVANSHLPYEDVFVRHEIPFKKVMEQDGFKIFKIQKP